MSDNIDIINTIAQNIRLTGIEKAELNEMAACLERVVVDPQTTLYHQGEEVTGLYLIISGQIQIFTPQGERCYFSFTH